MSRMRRLLLRPHAPLLLTFCVGLVSGVPAQKLVMTTKLSKTQRRKSTRIPATLVAEERLDLRARVSGYLTSIAVDRGSRVRRGDPLAELVVPMLVAGVATARSAVAEAKAAIGDAEGALLVAQAGVKKVEAQIAVCAADVKLGEVIAKRKRALVEQGGVTQAELDDAEGRLAMAKARASAVEAELEGTKAKVAAARLGVESAKARRASSEAMLTAAEARLAFAKLSCPLEQAVVTARNVDPGALIEKGRTVLLSLERTDKLRVRVPVPERDALLIRAGTPVRIEFDARPGAPVDGKVSRTAGALSRSRVLWCEIDIDNADGKLMPGMSAYVSLAAGGSGLTLPASAVRHDKAGKAYVFIVEGGRAKRVPVETGRDDGIQIEITRGIDATAEVIRAALVEDGQSVQVRASK